VEAEAEAVKFLWKRKHFEERSWTRKRLTLYGAGSGSKKTTASTSLVWTQNKSNLSFFSPFNADAWNEFTVPISATQRHGNTATGLDFEAVANLSRASVHS